MKKFVFGQLEMIRNFFKKFLKWYTNKCKCGGTFEEYDDKKDRCNKCGTNR